MLDEARAQRWLDDYVRAWETYDPAAIGELFSADAEYRWHPWDEGRAIAHGRQAIVSAWMKDRDTPGTYTGRCSFTTTPWSPPASAATTPTPSAPPWTANTTTSGSWSSTAKDAAGLSR